MAIEGRKEAKEIKRLEEEKVISNQRRKRKLSRCKKNFPIEVGGRSFMGENSVSEGVGEMPSNYIIQEQSQDFIGCNTWMAPGFRLRIYGQNLLFLHWRGEGVVESESSLNQ